MKKMYHVCVFILFAWVMAGSIIIFYLQNIDGVLVRKAIVQNNDIQNLETDKPAYHLGEPIFLHLSYCKYRQYQAETTWRLINKTVITYPTKNSGVSSLGCKDVWAKVVEIPSYATLGTHYIEGQSAIHVNAFRTVYINFKSKAFDVI